MTSASNRGRHPHFSIVIPTRDRRDLLRRALASIGRQTLQDFEVIVVDDGTSGGCAGVVREFEHLDIKLVVNSTSQGPAAARNIGVSVSTGSLISFLDDDDEYLETFVEHTARTLDSLEGASLTWSGVEIAEEEQPQRGQTRRAQLAFETSYPSDIRLFQQLLSVGIGFGVTVRRECFVQSGGFDERLKLVEDTDFFLRVVSAGYRPAAVPGVHVRLHNHRGARLTASHNRRARSVECHGLLQRYREFFDAHPPLHEQFAMHIEMLETESADMFGPQAYPAAIIAAANC